MTFCDLDRTTGHLWIERNGRRVPLVPLWLRERSEAPEQMDLNSHQRTYDPTRLPADLRIEDAQADGSGVTLGFSDGHRCRFELEWLAVEAGLAPDPAALPDPIAWTSDTITPPSASWSALSEPSVMQSLLDGFFASGFAILRDTPTQEDSLLDIARRFGPIRETNWGVLFNVRTEAQASDLAYTGLALTAHSDNPYRRAVPAIQFLHCLENGATGGDSTLADGVAIAAALKRDAPEAYSVLTRLPVTFRYRSATVDDRATAPMIDVDEGGRLRAIRLSTRLDFPPAADPEMLALFFEGRRRLAAYAEDPAFQIRFKLAPGDCLVMDNHRTLHGRTAFAEDGRRFLQGCYIDYDGPECLYRLHARRREGGAGAIAA
ncbi:MULTISPECIES: TauD/TfdA family dioxygenase [Thalassobaculum]|uniref:Gamma-butyrobetaine dioxygenase n=1 Tax=Thalassobaculum litoreum DSM 18839 TaxID=1123362 RepID=A0A8G2EW79_9PROT|nr:MULTISPECIES: TauD/TfdA family dioxygenase [Thalassobaculum]SDF67017.1 gamma-butyrobetaine dioxygenase [Thalassobaculum litoreum DSM 18839]